MSMCRVCSDRSVASTVPPCWQPIRSVAWAIFTSSTWSAIVPSRRPLSRSWAKGEPPTGASTSEPPPIVTSRAGFRGRRTNDEGARAAISVTKSRSQRTRSPSTSWPSERSSARARGSRTSVPISSRIRIA